MTDDQNYIKELDGLRAIAALMIIVFHFFQGVNLSADSSEWIALAKKVSVFGQTGVDLFFVLSGFLITRILLTTKGKVGFFKNFYIRRSLRIFPLYYFFLVVSFVIMPRIDRRLAFGPFDVVVFVAYLQNLSFTFDWGAEGPFHFWSLAVEEHFYLLWPLLVFLTPEKGLKYALAILVLLPLLIRYFMVDEGYEVFYFSLTRMDTLAMGAYLALVERNGYLKPNFSIKYGLAILTSAVSLIIIWVFTGGQSMVVVQVLKFSFIGMTYFFMLAWIISQRKEASFSKRLLCNPVLVYLGMISYGLYVYHPLSYQLVDYLNFSGLYLNFILGICLTIFLSTLSYYLLEKSFLKLKDRFTVV